MKIAVVNLTRGGISGGYKKYLRNIIPRMDSHPEVEAVLIASPVDVDASSWFNGLTKVHFASCLPFHPFRLKQDLELMNYLEQFCPDVLFIPMERYVGFTNIPVVNMLQNMESFVQIHDNPFNEKVRNMIQRVIARRALMKAQRTIAISGFVKDHLVNNLNIDSKKVSVIYYGIDTLQNGNFRRPDIIPEGWDKRFLFTAGSIRAARGLADVLVALKDIISKDKDISGLVIAGEVSRNMIGYQRKLRNWIKKNRLQLNVCWAGILSNDEMEWCYRNCKVFVMTSQVESFGMIALEAMANGCICISANNPCLPEIFGDAAVYYKPGDGKDLAISIHKLLGLDEQQRKDMAEEAQKRASMFSWDVTVEKTLNELKKAIEDTE